MKDLEFMTHDQLAKWMTATPAEWDAVVQEALDRAHERGCNAAETWDGTAIQLVWCSLRWTGQGRLEENPYRCSALSKAWDAGFLDPLETRQLKSAEFDERAHYMGYTQS